MAKENLILLTYCKISAKSLFAIKIKSQDQGLIYINFFIASYALHASNFASYSSEIVLRIQ